MSKLMSTAGAECVRAPNRHKSAPVAASSGIRAQRDAAGNFGPGTAAAAPHRLSNVVGCHVVEQQDVGAGILEARSTCSKRLDFDFDHRLRTLRLHLRHGTGDAAAEANVIVFDHHPVVQGHPMIGRASHRAPRISQAHATVGVVLRVSRIVMLLPAAATN